MLICVVSFASKESSIISYIILLCQSLFISLTGFSNISIISFENINVINVIIIAHIIMAYIFLSNSALMLPSIVYFHYVLCSVKDEMRFELMRVLHTNFQDWHHRPLGHSSIIYNSNSLYVILICYMLCYNIAMYQ